MRVRNTKVTRRQRFVAGILGGATVATYLVILALTRGESLLTILLIIAVAIVFVPLGFWVSDRLWGKAQG